MPFHARGVVGFVMCLLLTGLFGCATAPAGKAAVAARRSQDDQLGILERASVEARPKWQKARARVQADPVEAQALLAVPGGATVRIYLGTWCGDSRREVSRFWHALDLAGGAPPFEVELIGVDRALVAPEGLAKGVELRYVTTFVVLRGGKEVGRIVESPDSTIERDLAALLNGERTGLVTGRNKP